MCVAGRPVPLQPAPGRVQRALPGGRADAPGHPRGQPWLPLHVCCRHEAKGTSMGSGLLLNPLSECAVLFPVHSVTILGRSCSRNVGLGSWFRVYNWNVK